MNTQPRAPLALATAAFACGIWLATHSQSSPAGWGWATAALALCSILAIAVKSLRPAEIAAVLALVCAGSFARIATPVPRLVVPPPEFFLVYPDSFREEKVEIIG